MVVVVIYMKIVKCPKCKYEWETNSQLKQVTCPSCGLKVKNEEHNEK